MHKEQLGRRGGYRFAGWGTSAGCSVVEESKVVLKWKMFTKFDLAFKKLAVQYMLISRGNIKNKTY